MCGHVNVEKPASLEAQHDEHVKQPEANRRHHGEVDGDRMVSQERPPALRRRFPMPWHVLGERRLGEAEAKLDELAMDPGSTPGGIRTMHLDDEISNLWLVHGTAIGCSSASTGGSLVGASGPRSPGGRGGVLDAIPAKGAKARTRAPGRRSESGCAFRRTGAFGRAAGDEAREPQLGAGRETTAEIESQPEEPEGQATPSKAR